MRYILAHDVGTTGNKASLYDDLGRLVSSTFAAYDTEYAHPGWAEQNPNDWWRSLCVSTRQLLLESKVQNRDVACIVFSGQMMGAVPLDARGRPTYHALIWADQRSVSQIERVSRRVDPRRVYAVTGHRLSASYSAGKILWLREHDPDAYAETHVFVHAKDSLVARLTGMFVTDPSDASGTNLFDLEAGDWSDEMLEAFEMPRNKLPKICPSTEIVGTVRPDVADETGLAAGTPVVLGGGDGSCAATGAGVIREGIAYNYIGSSSWIGVATQKPILDPEMRTFTWAHLVPGLFTPTGTMQAAGSSYQWARDTFAGAESLVADRLGKSAYDLMNKEILRSPPGARGLLFLPYLLGERSPRWNPDARGAFVGLNIRHRPADLFRAVMEGITFNLRVILEAFQRQGARVEALRVIGGGARSTEWNAIMADIFGVPVLRLTLLEEATSMGAAVAGGVGVGIWKDFSQVDEMVDVQSECQPDPERHAFYSNMHNIFNDLYDALHRGDIFNRLTAMEE